LAKANAVVGGSCFALVPVAVAWLEMMVAEVKDYDVAVTLLTSSQLRATVKLSSRRSAMVKLVKPVFAADGTVATAAFADCSMCSKYTDTGLFCREMVAAINSARDMPNGPFWSIYELEFASLERHTATRLRQVSVEVPVFPFDVRATVTDKNPVLSWQRPPKRTGRKSKAAKRRQEEAAKVRRSSEVRSARSYRCIGCGDIGHNVKSCFNIDLDAVYRSLAGKKPNRLQIIENGVVSDAEVGWLCRCLFHLILIHTLVGG
jgi:hypothetical protein